MDHASLPSEFDGYRLVRLIGTGGMGRVYLGHDTLLDRPVAIKFVSARDPDSEARRRFLVEARAIARLQHPCVVGIYRVGEVAGHPYLVSEFVQGESLDRLRTPIPWGDALRIAYDLARGLAMAHRFGVIHRDIKPANAIRAADGTVKLLDFGIARLLEPAAGAGPSNAKTGAGDRPSLDPAAPTPPTAPAGEEAAASRAPAVRVRPGADSTITLTPDPDRDEAPGGRPPSLRVLDPDSRLTQPGWVLGTPAYMAPEVLCGEPASFASDVYSLGALAYGLCSGRPPHWRGSSVDLEERVLERDPVPLSDVSSGVDAAFAAVVDRCLRREPARRYPSANEVRAALLRLIEPRPGGALPEGNPYRGLRPFEAEHSAFFFGRDSEIRTVLERLSTDPVVVVAGDSGVGKSSLCRAGVLPRASEWLDRRWTWSVVTVVPGRHPAAALCAAVAAHLGVPEEGLASALAEGANAFVRQLRRVQGEDRGLVLFVDQFEEVVTLGDRSEAAAVADVLGRLAAPTPGLKMLVSVRGDFLGRLAALPALADALSRSLYFLRPLSRERVSEAITGPAEVKGVRFESEELVETLVESTVQAEGGLPLLAFALDRLWEARDQARQIIPASALAALGGVAGALSMHADEVVGRMRSRQRERARRMFLRLVTTEGTRAQRTRDELVGDDPDDDGALDALVRGRLVVARETAAGSAGYEIAHEALIRGWGTLAGWLTADADSRMVRERIAVARAEWERLGLTREALWSARQLAEVRVLDPADLSPGEAAFLLASRRAARRGRWLRGAVAFGAVLAVAITWGAVRLKAAMEIDERVDARLAAGRDRLASARILQARLDEMEKEAFALFDGRERDRAEEAWARVVATRAEEQAALAHAGRELEPAVALGTDRADVRDLFADVLYERARVAEERHDETGRDELLARMSLYDANGERTRRWNAPARLSIDSAPVAATLEIERYVRDPAGRLRPEPTGRTVGTPVSGLDLAPGSYRLTADVPGYARVRYPFTLGRGEEARFAIPLVRSEDVPPGFVYVAPGRFLFGSADEDSLRRGFLHAVPIHEVETGAYLIARNETTFAEWIEFLRALPEPERTSRRPAVHVGGFEGALTFEETGGDRWQLSFRPTVREYEVRSGERLTYEGRRQRVVQDWLGFPVVGVSAADAQAYVDWLRGTGRVPGARLCAELEWERAARGGDDRVYPHGYFLAPDDANFDETYGKDPPAMGPDEVGSHPASESPFGLLDMAGNVWEWAVSSVDKEGHAARGGSFYFDVNSARVANRETPEPSFRDVSVGFRVCADLPTR